MANEESDAKKRIESMKAECTWCQKRWRELEQSHGIGTATYMKDIGADDPVCSPEDLVRHDREQHEIDLEALAPEVGVRYVKP